MLAFYDSLGCLCRSDLRRHDPVLTRCLTALNALRAGVHVTQISLACTLAPGSALASIHIPTWAIP
jgi:hypothetical protein